MKAGLAGGVTFLVEYLVVTALIVVHPGLSTAADTLVEQLKSYGLILFNAHAVPITVVAEGVQYQGPTRFNMITDAANPVLPAFVYMAIPVLTLLIAGALFEWFRREGDEGVLEGGALVGTGLISGYLVVAVVASFAVATTTTFDSGSVTEGVDQVFAFATAIAYPLVVGSIGALVVRTYRDYAA